MWLVLSWQVYSALWEPLIHRFPLTSFDGYEGRPMLSQQEALGDDSLSKESVPGGQNPFSDSSRSEKLRCLKD